MKTKIILLLMAFVYVINVKSQTHFLKYDCYVYACDLDGSNIKAKPETAPQNSKFDSIKVFNHAGTDYVLIRFWKWIVPDKSEDQSIIQNRLNKITTLNYDLTGSDNDKKIDEAKSKINDDGTLYKHFVIKKSDFESYTIRNEKIKHWSATAGALTIPFKLRHSPFDFSKDIAMAGSGAFGYSFHKNFAMYAVVSLGISTIAVDSSNTEGKVKKSTNLSAFTLSPGFVLAWKSLQITFNCGWDFVSHNDDNKGWIYDNKPWVGFGIGYQLFVPQTSGSAVKNADKTQNSK